MPGTASLTPADGSYFVSANRRIHWSRRYEVQRFWRGMASIMGRALPRQKRAHVVLTFRFPDRRQRDVHNYLPLVGKPIIDGMVDAKVLPDDSDRYLVGPDMRTDPVPGPWRITITVTPLEDA